MALETVFLYAALGGGAVLLLQVAMMLIGLDDGGFGEIAEAGGLDMDVEVDGATDSAGYWFFEMISLRTLAAAVTLFGAVGRLALDAGQSPGVALALGLLAGYGAMYAVYWLFKQVFKLEASGTFDVRNAVDVVGEVYIPIDSDAAGKIQVKVQGRTVELQARTDTPGRLATGSKVVVTEVLSSDTVKVTPVN